jgi:hypothetical protein
MKLTNREMILGWATLLAVLLMVLYLIGAARWEQARTLSQERATLVRQLRDTERLLARRGDVDARLVAIRKRLPQYAPGRDVTADILRDLENTARTHNVTLTRRDAERERSAGELMEVSVLCTWEADLDGLVHFLYALESQGVTRQVRQLTVSPGPDRRLKGNVVADHAYTRGPEAAPDSKPEVNQEARHAN